MSINNPFVQLIAFVWLLATIACFATKDSEPIGAAFVFSVLAGIGYWLYKM